MVIIITSGRCFWMWIWCLWSWHPFRDRLATRSGCFQQQCENMLYHHCWRCSFCRRLQQPQPMLSNTRLHSSRMHTAHLLTVSQHALRRGCLPRGVTAQGVPAQGWRGRGVSARGMPARRCLPWGCGRPHLWTEWQTGVKTLPYPNFVAGDNYHFESYEVNRSK